MASNVVGEFGREAAVRFLTRGDTRQLSALINDANVNDKSTKARAHEGLRAAMVMFAAILNDLKDKGVANFVGAPLATRAEADYAGASGSRYLSSVLQSQVDCITQLRDQAPEIMNTLQITWRFEETSQAAMPVRVTAMPTRLTTTHVERNGAGEIAAAVQVERDS